MKPCSRHVLKARDMGQASTYKRKEKNIDPERRTKARQDPREVGARNEREETTQGLKGLEAFGREGTITGEEQDTRGLKRTREDLVHQMQDAAVKI